ncbi:MAG: response regulator transcription factor [Ferruginibacter sp.]
MIRIAVYDDSLARRESLQAFMQLSAEYEFVGSFENCNTILQDIAGTHPDLILMDIEMPLLDGISGVRLVKQYYPEIKVIMQTAFDDDEKVFAAMQAGAEGYLLKNAGIVQIAQSIDEVMKGGAAMTPSIALKVMRYFNQQQSSPGNFNLSPKEAEVLTHLANGLSYKMVADKMGISYFTVNNHVKKIYEKLQVHSLGEAIALAHKNRLV